MLRTDPRQITTIPRPLSLILRRS